MTSNSIKGRPCPKPPTNFNNNNINTNVFTNNNNNLITISNNNFPNTPTINNKPSNTTSINNKPNNNKTNNNKTNNTTNNSSTFRRTDVVKSGRLFVKKSFGLFNFKSWHERVLVLRDTWTEACQGGVSSLEVYHPPTNISTSTSTPTSTPTKPSSTQTFSFFSCISKKPNKFDTNSFSRLHHNSLPKHHHKHQIDHCYIDLSTVSSVDKHPSNKSFPHAFVLHRKDKDAVVFGAKSDLEAREWMMAIKHLSSKAHQPTLPAPKPPPSLTFEDRLERIRRQSREELNEPVLPAKRFPSKRNSRNETKDNPFPNVPKPPPRPKARKSNA